MDALQHSASIWAEQYVNRNAHATNVDKMDQDMQASLQDILNKNVPSKMSTTRHNHSWFNTQTKRILRRKARAYKKRAVQIKSVTGNAFGSSDVKHCAPVGRHTTNTLLLLLTAIPVPTRDLEPKMKADILLYTTTCRSKPNDPGC